MSATMDITLNSDDGRDCFSERRLSLHTGTTIPIGRSSRSGSKNIVAEVDNAFIDSPVISRNHANLSLEATDGELALFITDNSSMHGTFLNGLKLNPNERYRVHKGDLLQFGNEVVRGDESFPPRSFSVYLRTSSAKAATPETRKTEVKSYTIEDYTSSEDEIEEESDLQYDSDMESRSSPVDIEAASKSQPSNDTQAADSPHEAPVDKPQAQASAGHSKGEEDDFVVEDDLDSELEAGMDCGMLDSDSDSELDSPNRTRCASIDSFDHSDESIAGSDIYDEGDSIADDMREENFDVPTRDTPLSAFNADAPAPFSQFHSVPTMPPTLPTLGNFVCSYPVTGTNNSMSLGRIVDPPTQHSSISTSMRGEVPVQSLLNVPVAPPAPISLGHEYAFPYEWNPTQPNGSFLPTRRDVCAPNFAFGSPFASTFCEGNGTPTYRQGPFVSNNHDEDVDTELPEVSRPVQPTSEAQTKESPSQVKGKTSISIPDIIDNTVESGNATTSATHKRKVSEVEEEDAEIDKEAKPVALTVSQPLDEVPSSELAPKVNSAELMDTSSKLQISDAPVQQPTPVASPNARPSKKAKITPSIVTQPRARSNVSSFALSAATGFATAIGAVVALAYLPESLFL